MYGSTMQYLPGRCDACGFAILVAHRIPAAPLRPCPQCGAETSIFPGAKHQEEERALFEALSELVHEGATPGRAALVLDELDGLIEDAPSTLLQVIELRLPAISDTLLAARPSAPAPRLVAMLLTLLRARSSVRLHSSFEPLAGAQSADATPARRAR